MESKTQTNTVLTINDPFQQPGLYCENSTNDIQSLLSIFHTRKRKQRYSRDQVIIDNLFIGYNLEKVTSYLGLAVELFRLALVSRKFYKSIMTLEASSRIIWTGVHQIEIEGAEKGFASLDRCPNICWERLLTRTNGLVSLKLGRKEVGHHAHVDALTLLTAVPVTFLKALHLASTVVDRDVFEAITNLENLTCLDLRDATLLHEDIALGMAEARHDRRRMNTSFGTHLKEFVYPFCGARPAFYQWLKTNVLASGNLQRLGVRMCNDDACEHLTADVTSTLLHWSDSAACSLESFEFLRFSARTSCSLSIAVASLGSVKSVIFSECAKQFVDFLLEPFYLAAKPLEGIYLQNLDGPATVNRATYAITNVLLASIERNMYGSLTYLDLTYLNGCVVEDKQIRIAEALPKLTNLKQLRCYFYANIFSKFGAQCQLQELYLSNDPNWLEESVGESSLHLNFPCLTTLSLEDVRGLATGVINCPELRMLRVKKVVGFRKLAVCPSGSQQLPVEDTETFKVCTDSLKKMELEQLLLQLLTVDSRTLKFFQVENAGSIDKLTVLNSDFQSLNLHSLQTLCQVELHNKSLKKVELHDCPILQKAVISGTKYLQTVRLESCNELKEMLLSGFHLQRVEICECQNLNNLLLSHCIIDDLSVDQVQSQKLTINLHESKLSRKARRQLRFLNHQLADTKPNRHNLMGGRTK